MKNIKILAIVLMILLVFISITNYANAMTATDITNHFQGDTSQNPAGLTNTTKAILNIMRIVGIAAAVILLIMLAIKYISAAPSEKADIKKSATIYIIGAVLLFAASGILTIIQNFANNAVTVGNTTVNTVEEDNEDD